MTDKIAQAKQTEEARITTQERRTALFRAIYEWTRAQAIYMPEVATARLSGDYTFSGNTQASSSDNIGVSTEALDWVNVLDGTLESEKIILFLPSDIPPAHRRRVCKYRVAELETRYRRAALEDHLGNVRKYLRIYYILRSRYKTIFVGSVSLATRARTEIEGWLQKAKKSAAAYRVVRVALLALDLDGEWTTVYLELNDSDLRGPGQGDDMDVHDIQVSKKKSKKVDRSKMGFGHRTTSWIWQVQVRGDDAEEYMRVQWSTLSAYAERFDEELWMVPEEMRRVLTDFECEIQEWLVAATARPLPEEPLLAAALEAYAYRQISYYEGRIARFAARWIPLLREHQEFLQDREDVDLLWTEKYIPLIDMSQITGRVVKRAKIRQVRPRGLAQTYTLI